MKVFELVGKKLVEGDVGIEIECEGEGMKEVVNAFWKTEDDGSLRGEYPSSRAEFILKKPIPLKAVKGAIKNLKDNLPDAEFSFSFRTSVHVHLNVGGMEYVKLLNLMYTYLLLEEPLMTYCGKERKGNHFCLRLNDAEGMLDILNNLFRQGEYFINVIPRDAYRYSAMNLESLNKYGSLEFRGMRGNIDETVIGTWCEALVALRSYAESKEDPSAVFAEYAALEPVEFLNTVLGKQVAQRLYYPKMVKEIQRSFSLSLDLPYAYSAYVEEQKNQEEWKKKDWKIGDMLTYDQAVEFDGRGGKVEHQYGEEFKKAPYKVIKLALRGPAPKKAKVVRKPVEFNFEELAQFDVRERDEEEE